MKRIPPYPCLCAELQIGPWADGGSAKRHIQPAEKLSRSLRRPEHLAHPIGCPGLAKSLLILSLAYLKLLSAGSARGRQ
jgi:hypothetical protein